MMKFCLCPGMCNGYLSLSWRWYLPAVLWKKKLLLLLFLFFFLSLLSPPPLPSFLSSFILGNYCNFRKLYTALRFSEICFLITSHILSIFEQSLHCTICTDKDNSDDSLFLFISTLGCVFFLKSLFLNMSCSWTSHSSNIFRASYIP